MKKCTLIISILFLAFSSANAQFKIKLPSVKKPEVNKPTGAESTIPVNNPTSNTNSWGDVNSSRELVMDDAFTFFDASPAKEVSAEFSGEIDVGWYLVSNLRAFGTFPNRSGFNVVVSRGGKDLAKTRCETKPYRKASDPNLDTPEKRAGKDLNFDNWMQYMGCSDKTKFTKGEGEFDVKVYIFNGDTDAETLVKTYKIDVHRAARIRGIPAKPLPDVAHYYISRHAEAPVAFMHLSNAFVADYFQFSGKNSSEKNYNRLEVYLNYSPKQAGDATPRARIRCTVNGEMINFDNGNAYGDEVRFSRKGMINAIYLDRIAPKYKTGPPYREDVAFVQLQMTLPIQFGQSDEQNVRLEAHPGNWECDILSNGKKFRTLRWNVGSDGKPIAHPEQQIGNANLFYNAFMIGMEIPAGGSEFDHRLAPMPNIGFFYGIPWKSPEGKMMEANVPKVGNPYQTASK